MAQILYEPSSIRGDFGVLCLTEGETCNIPFLFELYYEDVRGEKVIQEIPAEDILEFIIKTDIKTVTPIVRKLYTQIKNNLCIVVLNKNDAAKLCGGRDYTLSCRQFSSVGALKRVLIKELPIRIQEVV